MGIPTIVRLKDAAEPAGERFNYTGKHRYVLALPVAGNRPVFATPAATVPVLDILREACWHYHFDVYAYCFLPARLVLIVRGREDLSQLKEFLRAFRLKSNDRMKAELGRTLWSKKYLERVLRKTEPSVDAARQLFSLPVKEGLAASSADYALQGSFVEEVRRFVAPPGRDRFKPGQKRGSLNGRRRREQKTRP
jgi:REP element-mobilizing transposase RayT